NPVIANIRARYKPMAVATAAQLQPTQKTARQPRWRNKKGIVRTHSTLSGLALMAAKSPVPKSESNHCARETKPFLNAVESRLIIAQFTPHAAEFRGHLVCCKPETPAGSKSQQIFPACVDVSILRRMI